MSTEDHPKSLTNVEIQQVREQLRAIDGKPSGFISRIGEIVTHPRKPTGDTKRHRFGAALLVFAVFQMVMVIALPDDHRRWLFFGFAWLTLLIGAWQVDKAK